MKRFLALALSLCICLTLAPGALAEEEPETPAGPPTETTQPSADPSADPSSAPSSDPSADPSSDPSSDPSADPSAEPVGPSEAFVRCAADAYALKLVGDDYAAYLGRPVTAEQLAAMAGTAAAKLAALEGVDAPAVQAAGNTAGDAVDSLCRVLTALELAQPGEDSVEVLAGLGVLTQEDFPLDLARPCLYEEAAVWTTRLVLNVYDAQNAGSKGLLWKAVNGDNTLYLLGTYHVDRGNLYPFHQTLREVISGADTVVMELDLNDQEGLAEYSAMQCYDQGETLEENIPKELYRRTVAVFEAFGLDEKTVNGFKPWALALSATSLLSSDAAAQGGYMPVDSYVNAAAVNAGVPIVGAETYVLQGNVFDSLSAEYQEAYLESAVTVAEAALSGEEEVDPEAQAALDEQQKMLDAMMDNWTAGDLAGFHTVYNKEAVINSDDELNAKLFTDRDPGMVRVAQSYLTAQEPQTVLMAVGAGHMMAPGGIVPELQAMGYQVEQVTQYQAQPSTPASVVYPRSQTVEVNGQGVDFALYARKDENGYETNYIRVRDLAQALQSTTGQFNVAWTGQVELTAGAAYVPDGAQGAAPFTGVQPYAVPEEPLVVNGAEAHLEAVRLTDGIGGGYTYYKLRDLGAALGFHVAWDDGRKMVVITTPEPVAAHIDLSFAGDTMLATFKGQVTTGNFQGYAARQDPSYFLAGVQSVLANDDFTVVNLENVLTDRALTATTKNYTPAYWYKGPTSNARILTAGSVEAVSLSNNHTEDYGAAGLADTKAAVAAAGLQWGNRDQTFFLEKEGYKIAVICGGMWNGGNHLTIMKNRLAEASAQSDFQVVFFHGGTERVHAPDRWKVTACRALVDAGADLVVGSHPHVLQPRETYKGVDILYSLGNFCYGGSSRPENATVIYKLKLTVRDGALEARQGEIVPCYVYTGSTNNFQPQIMADGAAKQAVLDFMEGRRSSPV